MQNLKKRYDWIDFAKGFTVFLVVLGHVFLGMYESNRFINGKDILLVSTQAIYIYHIPIFFALSGFLFRRMSTINELVLNIRNKVIIFGIPYIFYSIMQFTLQKIGGDSVRVPTTIDTLLNIYQKPIGVSWFLYTLFFIYVFVLFLTYFIKSKWLVGMIVFICYLFSLTIPSDIYVIQRTLLWTLFFFLGYIFNNEKVLQFLIEKNKKIVFVSFVLVTVLLYLWKAGNPEFYISYHSPSIWGLIFLISLPVGFSIYKKIDDVEFGIKNYFISLGKDSLVIYLLHAPIVSVIRIVLLKLGIGSMVIHIIAGLAAGWFGSILAIEIMKKVKYLDFVFYPAKYIKLKK